MKLLDFLLPEATIYDMQSTDKEGALTELLDALIRVKAVRKAKRDSILDALVKREELGSTGIGMGVAIPHTKHDDVRKLIGVVGRSAAGVDFKALDGEPVHVFFLILSPPDQPAEHLKALEQISCLIRHEHFCRFIENAKSLEELNETLEEADEKLFS